MKSVNVSLGTAINALYEYIKSNQNEKVSKLLDKMNSLNAETRKTLLKNCFVYAKNSDNKEVIRILLDSWSKNFDVEENDRDKFFSSLFGDNFYDVPLLSFAVISLGDYTYLMLAMDLIEQGNQPWITNALERAEIIFGPQSNETYSEIHKYIKSKGEEYSISYIMNFITARLGDTSNFAPTPKWIKNYFKSDLPTEKEIQDMAEKKYIIELNKIIEKEVKSMRKNPKKFVNKHFDSIKKFSEGEIEGDIEGAKKFISEKINENYINEIYQASLIYDNQLWQWFGPCNPLINQKFDTDSINDKYGGCRMFLCDYYDIDDDTEEELDWFIGYCEECSLRIKNRYYAVRMPRANGAWSGCYCSWTCTRKQVFDYELMVNELIDHFEEKMNEEDFGIQDRIVE